MSDILASLRLARSQIENTSLSYLPLFDRERPLWITPSQLSILRAKPEWADHFLRGFELGEEWVEERKRELGIGVNGE